MTIRGSSCALERIGPLAPLGGRWPRETAKIDTFHVWAYPPGTYRLRALNYLCVFLIVCIIPTESVFELQRAEVRTSTIAGKLCLPYLRKTSTDVVGTLYADRA